MGLYDVFDDIAERNIMKTETGDNRIFGIVLGEVVDNYDAERAGRVCVSIHTRDNEANVLKWARVCLPYSGKEWGMYFFPEVGDQVLVAFEGGNIERPYIIGSIPKDADSFLKKSKDEKNKLKRIVTKNGSTIEITDAPEDDGGGGGGGNEGDKIEIKTPEDKHSITLDDGKKQITIQDKEKKCKIEMKTENGEMNIEAAKKLTIKVGDNIKITMNGESGKLIIESKDISVDSQGKVNVSATGKSALSAAGISMESNSSLKLSASSMVTVEGKPIKFG